MGDEAPSDSGPPAAAAPPVVVTSATTSAPAPAMPHDGQYARKDSVSTNTTDVRTGALNDSVVLSERNAHPFSRRPTSLDMQQYFIGPRDLDRHSKWPVFLRMHGSILPEMILPLFFVGAWATAIRLISEYAHSLKVNSVLLTVLGFVVGLGLSFRSSTAYERYNEGRKYWSQLMLASQNLARVIWIHGAERPGDLAKEDLLAKMTALNFIIAFSVALKHKLRYEPYTMYDDLQGFVGHLDTFAGEATDDKSPTRRSPGPLKAMGEYLGVSFAESNPMKLVKQADKPVGNLPLEILNYLSAYMDDLVENQQIKVAMHMTLGYNNIAAMNDVLTGTDRILKTPLPIAYTIAFSQITWVYIIMLPFQLEGPLKWVMIPASIVAAYIILGILFIGREIENPFGEDVNDLPMESYCLQIAADVDVISSRPKPKIREVIRHANNKVLFPLSNAGYPVWAERSEHVIREELKYKAGMVMMNNSRAAAEAAKEAAKAAKKHKKQQPKVEEKSVLSTPEKLA